MKILIAIDGACRRNGKPDCTASGGLFIQAFDDNGNDIGCAIRGAYEYCSTNQRGELLALLKALSIVWKNDYSDVTIVTDSEYIFNAMTKQWYKNWIANDWLTRDGNPVKNRDLWENIARYADKCERAENEIIFYHVKGHCIPFGTVTATTSLESDKTGRALLEMVQTKFDNVACSKRTLFEHAAELSMKNNGFAPDINGPVFKSWVVANVMADAIATKVVDEADSRRET
jgi:ribonuclease HI